MEKKKNKSLFFIIGTLILIEILSIVFISFMGYMNFKTNFSDIRQTLYSFLTDDTIDEIEASLKFGKEIDNYYGADKVLNNIKNKLGEGFELEILDNDNNILYKTHDNELKNYNSYEQNILGIDKDVVGKLVTYYSQEVINHQLKQLTNKIYKTTIYLVSIGLLILLIGDFITYYLTKSEKLLCDFSIVIIFSMIIIQSIFSMIEYKECYKTSIQDGANVVVENLSDIVENVRQTGIELIEISDLVDFLNEKIENVPILYNIKLYENIVDTSSLNEDKKSIYYITRALGDSDIVVEVDLSTKYIEERDQELTLIILSTIIIMVMIVVEILKLPSLLSHRNSGYYKKECKETYEGVINGIQLVVFLCTTAEYICLPYSAMIIRNLNQGVLGLSVTTTSALPLTVEGISQMIAIFIFYKILDKIGSRKTLLISGIIMISINIIAFNSNSAWQIIICRAIAGIAYAGFAQVANYVVANGYDKEEIRTAILAHKNAGLLAGITCGAGLGAIISVAFSYSFTFLVSAGIFLFYILIFFIVMPWKILNTNNAKKDKIIKKNIEVKGIINMLISNEMIIYILFALLPLNIGIVLIVSLIPNLIQTLEINTVILSYCYIINGMVGIYLAPKLVTFFTKKNKINNGIAISLFICAISILILDIPFIYKTIIIVISSALLGFVDGIGTPLSIDQFMELNIVKNTVDEETALVFLSAISYILNALAPIVANNMVGENMFGVSRYILFATIFIICAILIFSYSSILIRKSSKNR